LFERCGCFLRRGQFSHDCPCCRRSGAAEKEFGAGLPGRDIDQLEPVFLLEKIDNFLVGDILHRPTPQPIADVGENIHSTLEPVLRHSPRKSRNFSDIPVQAKLPDIPPHHKPLLEAARRIVFLFRIEPKFLGWLNIDIGRVKRDVKPAPFGHGTLGIADRLPNVSGVMQYAPAIDEIPLAKLGDIILVQDVTALDAPARRVARALPENLASPHRVRIIIEAENAVGAGFVGAQRMEPAATADIKKIEAAQ
jgi:hypothetical protein